MLAHNRIANESGLIINTEKNSIGVTIMYSALGTPGGKRLFFMYPKKLGS